MSKRLLSIFAAFLMVLSGSPALADEYSDAIGVFKNAGASSAFFKSAYGYAVFPTIGKAGFVVGGAYGTGRVYKKGQYVGDTSVTQVSAGWQFGGQAYSQIIFFENRSAFDQFTSGDFAFSADANAVAVTAGANASASTTGSSAAASSNDEQASTTGKYYKGMATFTVAKGGLMVAVAVAGQKFTYEPRK